MTDSGLRVKTGLNRNVRLLWKLATLAQLASPLINRAAASPKHFDSGNRIPEPKIIFGGPGPRFGREEADIQPKAGGEWAPDRAASDAKYFRHIIPDRQA